MENGFDPIKIAIIVLVVVVQGVAAFRGWMKKREQQKQAEESRLGFPNRNTERTSEPASASDDDLVDWDPLGENQDEPDEEPEPPARQSEPARKPGGIVFPPVGAPEPVRVPTSVAFPPIGAGPLIPDSEHSSSASESQPEPIFIMADALQRQADPPKSLERVGGRLPGDGTLRSAMIAKLVLERPLSARRGFRRDPRG